MNDKTREHLNEEELQDAAEWWVRLRDRATAGDAAKEWLEWSSGNARRADAFERVTELGGQLRGLDAAAKDALVAEFVTPAQRTSRPWMQWAVAAMLVLTAGIGGYAVMNERIVENHYNSQVAENRELRLEDGSEVALGAASSMTTRFSRDTRNIELDTGEAFFQVAHNAQRPFVVTAGKLSVRAIGTAFNVRRDGDRVTVAIAEGRVRIASGRGNVNSEAIEAVAGQEVSYHDGAYGLVVHNVDPARVAGWRTLQFEFVDEPLAAVVTSINRYSRHPLRIANPTLAGMTYTGTVQADHLDSWLKALPMIFPLKVEQGADAIVLDNPDNASTTRE